MKCYFIYMLASKSRVLYVGYTNDLRHRMFEHREGLREGFTKRYRVNRLVYYETTTDRIAAENRERRLKGLTRARKILLIESMNPLWNDLAEEWFTSPKSLLL